MKKHEGFTNREAALLDAWDECNRLQIDAAFEARVLEAVHEAGRSPCEHEQLVAEDENAVVAAMVADAADGCMELPPVTGLLRVVEEILRETTVPMSVREIVERAGASLPTRSKTPDVVVARDLSMHIKRQGEHSIFVRTSPGRYTLRTLTAPSLVPAAPLVPAASSMVALPQRRLTLGGRPNLASERHLKTGES
jgi:hypothetical protein